MPSFLRPIFPALVAVGAFAAAPALAQPAPSPQAEALFAEGRAALHRGDYPTACARFAESFERSGSLGPLLNLAECEERRGHLASALSRWKQGVIRLESLPRDERMPLARRRVAALEGRLPHLTIKLANGAASGVTARLDEQPIKTLPSEALAVDPGEHWIAVTAPDHPEQRLAVTLAEGETKEIAIGAFASKGADPPREGDSKRTAGFVVGGVGLAGLTAFGITGALMFGQRSIVDVHCDEGSRTCDSAGSDAAATGRALGRINAAALVVGVVGVGVGAVLVFTSRGESGPTTALRTTALPGGAGLSLHHTF